MNNENTIKFDFQNLTTNFFGGFYESSIFNSDSLNDVVRLLEVEKEAAKKVDENFNFTNFQNEFGKEFASILRNFDEKNLFQKIEFTGFKSPKFYNYSTDKICLKIVANENFEKYISEKRQKIFDYFEDLTFESLLNDEKELLQFAFEYYFIQIMEENTLLSEMIYEAAQNCLFSEIENCL